MVSTSRSSSPNVPRASAARRAGSGTDEPIMCGVADWRVSSVRSKSAYSDNRSLSVAQSTYRPERERLGYSSVVPSCRTHVSA